MKFILQAIAIVLISVSTAAGNLAYAVDNGAAMPACKLTPLGEQAAVELSRYKGQVLYVDFWASWCGPCAKSFPFMNELHQQLKAEGLQVVAVNLDENVDDAKAFLKNIPADFTVLADVSKQCAKDFDVKAMPSTYIIDKQGVVKHIHLGFKPGEAEEIKTIVEKLVTEKVAALSP